MIYRIIFIFSILIWLFTPEEACNAQDFQLESKIDEVVQNSESTSRSNGVQDSSSNRAKLSMAPIVAFGVVGMFVGGYIGSRIDPAPECVEGEPCLNISKGGSIGALVGTITGAYIGYQLAKKDQRRQQQVIKKKNHKP